MTSEAAGAPGAAGARKSGWAPLRTPGFRNLWTAQFVSNIGSWMQTVAAQWVMVSLTSSALLIGAIQSASSIPVLLLAVPSGVLGDLVDRRRLILATQVLMLLAAAVLALLSALHDLNPGILLGLLFVLGIGTAASAPTWQTLQPELVTPEDRPQAIALGSVNQNLARAIGPAIGGALLAATSAALVFGVNAVSFVAVLVAVFVTAVPKRVSSLPREHALDAARAGGRFVANSPRLLALIARSIAFILPAGSIWALLPLIARGRLHLGATGYGLLLGCVGVGAVVAATYGPTLRQLAPRLLYALSAAAVGVGALVLAVSSSVALDAVLLVLAGGAWITGIGLLGAAYQSEMPQWVKARGMSYYLVGFQGSNAIGGLAFGALASATTVRVAFLTMAGFLLVTVVGTWRLALPRAAGGQFEAASDAWPLPMVDADSDDADSLGPVMVNVEWHVDPAREDEFLGLAKALRGVRRRTGAISWRLYRRAEDSHMFVETCGGGSGGEPPTPARKDGPARAGGVRPARGDSRRGRGAAGRAPDRGSGVAAGLVQLPRTLMGLLGHHVAPAPSDAPGAMPPGLQKRSIRNGVIRLTVFAVVVVVIVVSVPGLASIRSRLDHGVVGFVVAAAGFRFASALSYVVLFRAIFAPEMARGLAYRIAMTEIGLNALVPAGGAGGLAVGGFVLHRQGMKTEDVVARSAELFVFTSAFNVGAVAVLGWLGTVGVISTHAALVFSLVPAVAASCVVVGALAAAPRLSGLRARQASLARVHGLRWWTFELLVMLGTGAGGALRLFRSGNVPALLGGAGYLLFDIAVLWAAVRAFHGHPALGALALAYLIGQLAGEIPVPGGIGAVDGGLIGTMVLYGLPASVATAAALAYRAIALGVPTVFGGLAAFGLAREIRVWPARAVVAQAAS